MTAVKITELYIIAYVGRAVPLASQLVKHRPPIQSDPLGSKLIVDLNGVMWTKSGLSDHQCSIPRIPETVVDGEHFKCSYCSCDRRLYRL